MKIIYKNNDSKSLLLIGKQNDYLKNIEDNLNNSNYYIELSNDIEINYDYKKYACIIIDINIENHKNIAKKLNNYSLLPILLISKNINNLIIESFENLDFYGYFEDPVNFQNLIIAIESVINSNHNIKNKFYINKVINELDEAIIYTDENDNVHYMNKIAENLTGWNLQDAYNKSINKIFNVLDNKKKSNDEINKDFLSVQELSDYNDDLFLYSKNGIITQIEKRVTKIENNQSNNKAIIFSDITDLAWQQKMLYKLFKIVEQSPIGIMITDEHGKIEFINNYFEKISGYQLKNIIGKKPDIFKSNKYNQQFYKFIWETLLAGNNWDGIICNKNKNSEYYWNDTKLSPLKNENNTITNFISITNDITDKLRNREKINNIQNSHKRLLESVGEAIIGFDNKEKIIFVNRIAEKILGLSINDLIGKKCFNILRPKISDNGKNTISPNIFQSAIDNFTTYKGDNYLFKNNEEIYFPVKYNITPYIEKNQCAGAVLIFSNISNFKVFEDNLFNLNKELDNKNKELEKIINIVSLDLKIPLINIQGLNSLLLKAVLDIQNSLKQNDNIRNINKIINEEIFKEIKYMENNILSLNSLINNLIEYSRLETLDVNFKQVNVDKLVNILCASYNRILKYELVNIICEVLPEAYGDEKGINTIMHNLIDNAVKYKKKNKKTIIKLSGIIKDNKSIYCIEDNGVGISSPKQKVIFDLFHKFDADNCKGIGVGLAICKKIINKHNGKIWVESKKGAGSKFYIELLNFK